MKQLSEWFKKTFSNGLVILGLFLALAFISWYLYDEYESVIFLVVSIAFFAAFIAWRAIGTKGMKGKGGSES